MVNNLYAIILAGGSGTRLWPLSRKYSPKQLLKIVKGQSLLDMTIKRSIKCVPAENIVVVSSVDIASEVRTSIQSNLRKKINFIEEPIGKNTATAIGVAAAYVTNKDPDGSLIVFPSDQLIEDDKGLQKIIQFASIPAFKKMLVTFGIKPDSPETGFGYIKPGAKLISEGSFQAEVVDKFYEKPDAKRAEELISQGCLWNSGIFVFKAETLLCEIQKYIPELGKTLHKLSKNFTENNFMKVFDLQTGLSIDKGVLEKADNVAVIPADIKWKDLGSFAAIEQLYDKDKDGNILLGDTIDIGSKDSIIYGNERLIATIGLDNIAIIDTADVTLVSNKDKVQEVKQLVDLVKERGGVEHLIHKTVERPWGSYTVLNHGLGFKVKRVVVEPNESLSLQFHRRRSEHWVVVSGKAKIQKEEETTYLHPGESTFLPATMNHRLENPGPDNLILIEVQIGEYLEEDDIERIYDYYGRLRQLPNNPWQSLSIE